MRHFYVILGLFFVRVDNVYGGTTAQCPIAPLIVPGITPQCGMGQYFDTATNLCCFTNSMAGGSSAGGGGGTGARYCETALVVGSNSICPTTHPLDPATGECCGSTPINGNAGGGRGNRGGNNNGGNNGPGGCQDLTVSGRPNDCQINANLCNNTLYYALMTQQCPVTCNRCNQLNQNANVPGCVDGVNAKGVSECPENKFKCDLPLWKTFMDKECPATCGRCAATNAPAPPPIVVPTGGASSTTPRASTTSSV